MLSNYKKLTKQEINDLPLRRYDGQIYVAASLNNANRAIDALLKENVIGFDTETRPAFRQNEAYLPSILQLAGHDAVYIFQLNKVGLCERILRILSNPDIIKCGVGLERDLADLMRLQRINDARRVLVPVRVAVPAHAVLLVAPGVHVQRVQQHHRVPRAARDLHDALVAQVQHPVEALQSTRQA